jgi:3-oxoacyl-[acyl-carrier protein] reductase
MSLGIENRVAIVCGASKGIGLACAMALAAAGAKILIIGRDEKSLANAAQSIISQGGIASTLAGDVQDKKLAELAVKRCEQLWGSVSILINNAGGPPMGRLCEHGEEAWEAAVQTNLMSVVRFCKAVIPAMKSQKWGRIISITSTVSKEPSPSMILSATTRAGVSALTKALAIELAQFEISVNAVCPGGVLTGRLSKLIQERADRENSNYDQILSESIQMIPARRFATPEEIANVVAFLASTKGGYINGVSISVDGALTKAFN